MQNIQHDSVGETQGSESCLCILDANCVAMTRPLPVCPSTRCISRCSTDASLVVRPGDSTLVESLMNSVAPSRPARSPPNHMSLHHNLKLVPKLDLKHIRTYTFTYIHTYIHNIRTHVCAYVHTYTHTYIRTCIRTHTHIHADQGTCLHTYIHTHTHIPTYVRAYIHAYVHVHAYIQTSRGHVCVLHQHDDNKKGTKHQVLISQPSFDVTASYLSVQRPSCQTSAHPRGPPLSSSPQCAQYCHARCAV